MGIFEHPLLSSAFDFQSVLAAVSNGEKFTEYLSLLEVASRHRLIDLNDNQYGAVFDNHCFLVKNGATLKKSVENGNKSQTKVGRTRSRDEQGNLRYPHGLMFASDYVEVALYLTEGMNRSS